MDENQKVVLGMYKTRSDLEWVIDVLKSDGFATQDISVLMPKMSDTKSFMEKIGTKAPEGAAAGAGTGAVLGGTIGLLAGIGALAIPGIGPFIAAGPIMSALAGAGVGGAIGGIGGALIGLGLSENEAKRYEGYVKEGGILLSVHTDNSQGVTRAQACLERTGAEDITTTSDASEGAWHVDPKRLRDDITGRYY